MILYSTGNYIQYLIKTYNGKESGKLYTHTHTHTDIYVCERNEMSKTAQAVCKGHMCILSH